MANEIAAFRGGEEPERHRDQIAHVVKGPGTCGSDEGFQFREGEFDRIEIWAVRRQETELGADGFDRRAHRGLFVDGEIVEHHHIAGAERGDQDLLDVGEKRRIVDRSVEDGRGGVRFPMTAGRVIAQARAAQTAAISTQQIRRDSAFIQKQILRQVAEWLPGLPLAPGRGDIRPTLLVGVYRFF